jgi:hypothetical protein
VAAVSLRCFLDERCGQVLLLVVVLCCASSSVARTQCVYTELDSRVTQAAPATWIYQFEQTRAVWSVIAIRPEISEEWEAVLYGSTAAYPTCLTNALLGTSSGVSKVTLVVGDFRENALKTYYFIANPVSGSGSGTVEWDDGNGPLAVNDTVLVRNTGPDDVVQIWDLFLLAGHQYTISCDASTGVEPKIVLFENPSPGNEFWGGREHAVVDADPSYAYTPTSTGYFGLVVVNDSGVAGTYDLSVGECTDPVMLQSNVPQNPQGHYNFYQFDQTESPWMVLGYRYLNGGPAVAVYETFPYGIYPSCMTDYLFGLGTPADLALVVGNLSQQGSPPGTRFARLIRGPGGHSPKVEWDAVSELVAVDGLPVRREIGTGDVAEIWHVPLVNGETYTFNFSTIGDADLALYLFGPNIPGWAGIADAAISSLSTFQYTATATGDHGVVVANRNNERGSFAWAVTSCPPPTPLTSGVFHMTPELASRDRLSFRQLDRNWTAVGVRSPAEWRLTMYHDPSGSASPVCFGDVLAFSNLPNEPQTVELIVGDFNRNPIGEYYAYPIYASGLDEAMVEWESGSGDVPLDGGLVNGSTGISDILDVWDVFLIEGVQYQVYFNRSSAVAAKLFLFEGATEEYWATRTEAVLTLDTLSTVPFDAPSTGRYGVVVVNDNGVSGTYQFSINSQTLPVESSMSPAISAIRALVPNPTSGDLSIQFAVARAGNIAFEILDVAGRRLVNLPASHRTPGSWSTSWNGLTNAGTRPRSGVYFVRMTSAEGTTSLKKFVLLE